MRSLILILCSALISVHAQTVPCWSFWDNVKAGEEHTINDQCYEFTDFPHTPITQSMVKIAYVEEMHGDPNLPTYASRIWQAIQESLNVYNDLQAYFNGVVVILTNFDDPDFPKASADTYRPFNSGPCQTRIFNNWVKNYTPDQQQQAIAHEMYHCVQDSWAGNPGEGSSWWVEGTAHYFSNVVYPRTNLEWKDIPDFQAFTPIPWQPNPYSCDVIFQSWERSKGAANIHQWVKERTATDTQSDERTVMSTADGFPDDFHLFSKLYTFQSIYDTDGQLVPSPQPPDPVEESLITTGDDATTGTVKLSLDSFTIGLFSLQIGSGQTVSISYTSSQSNARLSYRQPTDTVWTTMPSGGSSMPYTAPGTIVLPCNNGEPISILILFTSTDDVDTASADITVAQTFPDNTCLCNTPRKRNGQVCTAGFVPTGIVLTDSIFGTPTPTPITSMISSLESPGTGSSSAASSTIESSSAASSTTDSSSAASSNTISSSNSVSITPTPSSLSPTSSAPTSSAPTSSATGSCTLMAAIKPDPCLTGSTWTLDLASIEALIKNKESTLTAETVNSLSLSGTGSLVIEGTNATFSYKAFTIDLDVSVEGIDVPTTTVVNGDFEANLYLQGDDKFCLDVYSGEGSADITSSVTGDISLDLGPAGGFVPESLSISYTCMSGQLTMQGYLDGASTWGPYVYTS